MDTTEAAAFVAAVTGMTATDQSAFRESRASLVLAGCLLTAHRRLVSPHPSLPLPASSASASLGADSRPTSKEEQLRSTPCRRIPASDGYILPAVARLILTFADCHGFFSGLSFLTACEALARCLSPPPQGVPADNPEVGTLGLTSGQQFTCLRYSSVFDDSSFAASTSFSRSLGGGAYAAHRASKRRLFGQFFPSFSRDFLEPHFFVFLLSLEYTLSVRTSPWASFFASTKDEMPVAWSRLLACRPLPLPKSASASVLADACELLGFSSFCSVSASGETKTVNRTAGLVEPVRGYLGPPGSLRRQQQRFKLLSEVAEVLLPSAVASSARLHAFLLFLLRLLPPLAASSHRLALRKTLKADASASAAASSSSSVPSASSLSSSEASVAADCSPSACFSSAVSTCLLLDAVPGASLSNTQRREGSDVSWQQGNWVLEAEEAEQERFTQLLLTIFLATVAGASSSTLRSAMSISSPVAVNEQGDVLSSGSEKSSSSRNVLSSFRRPSAASLSSSSLASKSFSSMPASDQALQECREPRQEGESDRLAGRHRRSCRNRVLSESFPSPLFDALVHALVEKYADPEGLVGLLASRCTPTRIQQREDECSHLPDSVSSSASLPSPALRLGKPHDEEPDAHACRQAQTGGSNAERLQPAASAQPPRRDRRTTPRESNETRSATLLLSSCPVFVLLRALVNRLCEQVASSEACDEEGMDSSHSDAATRREGHRGVVLSATLSARDAANLGGGNRGRTCWGLGDSSYGATGRGDSARAKVGERGDRNALLDDLGKRRMMHTEEEDVGEGLCVEQAEDFLKMCLSLHAPRRTFTLNAFPGPQETEDDDGEVQEVGGSSASARRSAGLKSDGRSCEDAAHRTSGTSAFTSFPFLQYFWDAENMPSSQAWALRQARPVFVNARQEASFYLRVSSAANELLSVFVTSQERKAKALLVGLASRQLATRSRQPGCGAGRVSVAHSLSPRKATKDLQVSRAEGCGEGEDSGDDDGGRRTTPLSPHDLKAHLLLYICGNNELNTNWRHLGARLLFTLPATNLATLRDVLPVQNPRHERCLSGALSCHELVSLLFRFFAPFADETAERKETRSQTRRLFNHEELEEKRENPKTKQQVQPIQLLTVLGLVATSATLCDPGAPHALRVVALLSLQNVRPPGGKRLSPSLLSSLSVTSSLSSFFPASYHVGRGNLRGLSTAALSRHAEPGRAEDESEPANELEIEDVERLARMIGCASPSMALITSTVAQISREDDAPALLHLGRIRDQGETEEGEGERTRDAHSLLDSLSEPPEAEGKANERLSPSEVGVSEPLAGVVACSPAPSVSHDPAPTHVRHVEDSETTGNRNERRNKDDDRMIFGSPSFVSPASRSLSHADHLAAAGMCMKALQFVRVYVSQVAGGAAPEILRSRPKKEAKGPKARKKRETEDAKLADTKANVQCGAGDTDACVKGDKTDADEACGEEAKNDERVEGRQTHSTEISVEAYATSRGEAVMPAKERFACLERRRSSGGKGRACGRSEMETKAGAPRTSTALGVKREGPADPQKPRQTHPFFQRRGQCKAPVTSEASIGRIPNHEDCSDISADFCIPQKRPNEVAGIREPSRSCSRSFPPTDGASSAWTADVSFSPLASLGLLRQGLGGDLLDNFLHFWSALDLQAIAFVALQLGCPVDALIFAEQELERRCPDSGLEEGLAVVSQQWQRSQWDRMPQIRSVQVLRQMLLEAQRGQGRGPDEVPRPPRAVANAAPDQEEARGGKGGAAEGGTDEQGTWEKTEGVAEGAGRALDCGHVVPGDKGKGEEGTVGSDGNRPSKEQRMSPESMRHFQLSLQRLREMAIRPANASALLTPVGPAPLFLLVSQALINANEEDLSAVTDCLSPWHTSNFLIQRMHAENDWLATLTLQQEQLETLEAKRLQVLAQLRQLHSTGLHGHPGQGAWSASSIGLEARSVFENEAVGRSRIPQTGDRDLHTRLREVEEELYATKLQMADALGAIGLHSLRESLLVSLSLSSSAPSQLSHSPSYPSLACTLSSQRSPMDFGGSWSGPGGGALGGLGTRPFSASIGVGFPPLLEDEGKETDCGATAWLEKKFECLWRLRRWDCDETPWGASQTEICPTFDSNADLTESFSPCPRRPRDQTQPSLSLFNGCIYATLSLIHGAASCHPSSLVCPLQSSQACSKGARASHSATCHQQKSLFSTPEDVIVDAGADAGNGDQVDGEAEEALSFQRGLSSTMVRLRAVQTSRHALALALERLARSPQLADSSLSSIGHSSVDAQDQSLSRRLLGAYVELSMAHALQRATTLNLLLNQCEQDWNDDPCGAASFEHLQSSWANDLAVTAGAASASSSSASSSSLSSLPFFLEPLVSLETCILQAAIPSFHCIPPSAPFLPRSFETWTLRDASGAAACMRERQEDTLRFQRCCGDRGEALTDAHACGCHVRRPAARHLLLLSQMKRERGDWRGSLENLLQAKEHLLQLQRDRERPFWEAVPVRSTERLGVCTGASPESNKQQYTQEAKPFMTSFHQMQSLIHIDTYMYIYKYIYKYIYIYIYIY
ncbi:hypothetical protein TGRUB_429440, partial [Toxoplasma gondii RUB]